MLENFIQINPASYRYFELAAVLGLITKMTISVVWPFFKPFFEKKTFKNREEINVLFQNLNIRYLNNIDIQNKAVEHIDPKQTQYYKEASEMYDNLAKKYEQDIKTRKLAPIFIHWINNDIGYGAFANDTIKKDDFIGIYGGIVTLSDTVFDSKYSWSYIQNELASSLDGSKKGNELRFLNDANSPNCHMETIIGPDNRWYICYIASEDIAKGEQLFISYGGDYWKGGREKIYNPMNAGFRAQRE